MIEDVSVRVGTLDDLDAVMALARLMHEEIGITGFNADKVLPEVYGALARENGIMGLIGPIGGEIEGAVLLVVSKLFYSDDDVLQEKGLFVPPNLRASKGGRAARLCEFAKQAAQMLEMPLLIGIQNDSNIKGKMRLYERMFGDPVGAMWLYRPDDRQEEAA